MKWAKMTMQLNFILFHFLSLSQTPSNFLSPVIRKPGDRLKAVVDLRVEKIISFSLFGHSMPMTLIT